MVTGGHHPWGRGAVPSADGRPLPASHPPETPSRNDARQTTRSLCGVSKAFPLRQPSGSAVSSLLPGALFLTSCTANMRQACRLARRFGEAGKPQEDRSAIERNRLGIETVFHLKYG
jgi:hypothetical protein